MKKLLPILVLILSFSMFTHLVSAAGNDNDSNTEQIRQVVDNFYTSINEKDSQLYLDSIANPLEAANQFNAKHLVNGETIVDFEIVNINKINEQKYEVSIIKTQNGIVYPTIPYDVILQQGKWRFDPSNIVIYPIDNLPDNILNKSTHHGNIISENEDFLIAKTTNNFDISLMGSASYNFNTKSTDIYFSGTATVKSTPGYNDEPNDTHNWVLVEILKKIDTGEEIRVDHEIVSAYNYSYTTFINVYGYHKASVYNYNYPWLEGTFTVGW